MSVQQDATRTPHDAKSGEDLGYISIDIPYGEAVQ